MPDLANAFDGRAGTCRNVPKPAITAKMQNEPIFGRASRNALQNPALRAT
jgi:hypothetical protein